MPDLYAREVARYVHDRSRFELVEVDVYQRGAGREEDDLCHLRGLRVVVPSGAQPPIVDAVIGAALLQLQQQAGGEAVALVDQGHRTRPPVFRRNRAVGAQPLEPTAIAEAAAHYGLVTTLRALEARAAQAEQQLVALRADEPVSVSPAASAEA